VSRQGRPTEARPTTTKGAASAIPTRRKLLAAQRREVRRDEIMKRAAQLIEKKGYSQTSVGDIAQDVGMSKPTIYHYFHSKEEILYSIHDTWTSWLLSEHQATCARIDDPLEQLRELFVSFLEVTKERRAQVRVFFSHFDELKGDYRKRIEERRRELSDTMQSLIARSVSAGKLRDVDARLAMLCISGIFNWAPYWYRPRGGKSPRELADFVFELVIDGLRPRTVVSARRDGANPSRRSPG
jgi:AcrR family transcriptional regulator